MIPTSFIQILNIVNHFATRISSKDDFKMIFL